MIYDTYVMDCPNCGPGTYRVEEGVRLGCLCDYEPPSLVIRCADGTAEALDDPEDGCS